MVPYLPAARASRCAEAAVEFGISEQQLVKDLELLFVCGTPGHLPDDLIEAEWDDGHVYLNNADTIARPLRLGVDEALALIVGLRALAEVPGLHDRDALDRTLAKLEAAAGDAARRERPGLAWRSSGRVGAARGGARGAARATGGCTCATSSQPATRRPSATSTPCGCCSSTAAGTSRAGATARRRCGCSASTGSRPSPCLDVPPAARGRPPQRDLDEGLFAPSPEDTVVTLELDPPAHWVADYYPVEAVEELADGQLLVRLRAADDRWLRTLALRLGGAARVLDPP